MDIQSDPTRYSAALHLLDMANLAGGFAAIARGAAARAALEKRSAELAAAAFDMAGHPAAPTDAAMSDDELLAALQS